MGDHNADVTITKIPYDPSAENEAMVGRWKRLGDPIHDEIDRRKYGERFDDSDLNLEAFDDGFNFNTTDPATRQAMADAEEYYPDHEQEDWEL